MLNAPHAALCDTHLAGHADPLTAFVQAGLEAPYSPRRGRKEAEEPAEEQHMGLSTSDEGSDSEEEQVQGVRATAVCARWAGLCSGPGSMRMLGRAWELWLGVLMLASGLGLGAECARAVL